MRELVRGETTLLKHTWRVDDESTDPLTAMVKIKCTVCGRIVVVSTERLINLLDEDTPDEEKYLVF